MASPGYYLAMTVACDLGEEVARLQGGMRELLDALHRGEDVDVAVWRDRLEGDAVCGFVDLEQPWVEPCCAYDGHRGGHVHGVRAPILSRAR